MRSVQRLPNDWNATTLGQLADYINGYPFKPADWGKRGLPIIRIAQMTDPDATCDRYSGVLSDRYLIDNGDLLFSWSATLMTLIWDRGKAYLNQHLFKVVPRVGTDLNFLHHLLDFKMQALAGQTHGTTMKHIKRSDLLPFAVVIPARREQQQIAGILDLVDRAVGRTEQLIAKLERVKVALVHDLLTWGIDDKGELRDPQRHPEQFKESPLGTIPTTWKPAGLTSYLEADQGIKPGPFGSSLTKSMYSESGYRVYGQEQVIAGSLQHGDYYVPETKFRELAAFEVIDGDVLVSLVGTIGRILVVESPFERGIINPRLLRLRPGSRVGHPGFVGLLLRSDQIMRQLANLAGGGTMPVLNGQIIRRVLVPWVPLKEQVEIFARVDAIEQRLRGELAAARKLDALRHGLMDDLIAGRVRVTTLFGAGAA